MCNIKLQQLKASFNKFIKFLQKKERTNILIKRKIIKNKNENEREKKKNEKKYEKSGKMKLHCVLNEADDD